jgi:hypothetical protein
MTINRPMPTHIVRESFCETSSIAIASGAVRLRQRWKPSQG